MYRNPNPACTKTLKWMQPNEKNVTGSSITIIFHSKWGKKTFLKAQKCSKFHRRDSLHERVFELIIHAKAKSWVFPTSFAVFFIGCSFAYRTKSLIQLWTNMYITIFVFLSLGGCFKSTICIQNSLASPPIALFSSRFKGRKNYSQEKFEGSVLVDLPFWGHLNIDSCFSFPF